MKSNVRTTLYLLFVIALGYIATDLYLPSLPAISEYFGASENNTQRTLFSYLLSFAFAPLFFGPLSDHIGRKKVIISGLSISIAATILCLFSPNIYWLILGRFIQGIGAGAVLIAVRSSVADLFTGKEFAKQTALMTMLMPLILSISPTIGGFIQQALGWQAVFVTILLYMLVALFVSIQRSETLVRTSGETAKKMVATYRMHFQNRTFVSYGINFVLPGFGLFAYLTASPFLFQEVIGLSPLQYGSLALYVGATIMITGFANYKLVHRFEIDYIILFGIFMMLLAGALLLIFHFMGIVTTWSLLAPALVYFTCMPFCIANISAKAMGAVSSHFGAATALLTTFQFFIGSLASFVISLTSDRTFVPLAICFIGVGLLSLINFQFNVKKHAIAKG